MSEVCQSVEGLRGLNVAISHQDAFIRILNAYPMGSPVLIQALVTYVDGVVERAKLEAQNDMAETVCEGLHDGKPKGLKCRACYDAEMNAPGVIEFEADRQIMERIRKGE